MWLVYEMCRNCGAYGSFVVCLFSGCAGLYGVTAPQATRPSAVKRAHR